MHDRVREYLEAKRAQTGATQARTQYQERRRVLLDAGLYERVYAPAEQTYANEEYPNREVDAQGRERFFKAVTYDVTDEEYEEIKGYVEADKQPSSFAAARASVSSACKAVTIGIRPTSSGMSPYLTTSCAVTSL